MKKGFMAGLALLAGLTLAGCTNTIQYGTAPVANESVDHKIGMDKFEQATESMLADMLDDAGVQTISKAKRPMLAVYGVLDITSEKLDVNSLNALIMKHLDESSRFRFVSQDALKKALTDLNPNPYDLEDKPAAAQPLTSAVDADYLLIGEISKIIRAQPTLKQVYYRVSLKLVDPKDKKLVWQGKREFLKDEKKIIYGI